MLDPFEKLESVQNFACAPRTQNQLFKRILSNAVSGSKLNDDLTKVTAAL
jgi:hypothetical protein